MIMNRTRVAGAGGAGVVLVAGVKKGPGAGGMTSGAVEAARPGYRARRGGSWPGEGETRFRSG